MKIVTLGLLTCFCFTSTHLIAADAPTEKASATPQVPTASNQRQQVPAAKGPALELAIEAARVAIETCAADGSQKVAVSVVDSAGVLKVLLAADGASPRGVASSTHKAVTALNFKIPTSQLGEHAKTDTALSEKIAADTAINARPGGVLLKAGDKIIGAIGVGGGKTDEPCALKGIEKIQARLE